MARSHPATPRAPADQADGLRRLFGGRVRRFMPLVANPYVVFSGVVLERVTTCFAMAGVSVLLVDAADSAPATADLALLDLSGCVERLDEHTHYLAARGLPRAFVDARGSAAKLLPALTGAAPQAEVIVVHGEAGDLARIFQRVDVRPLLLCAERVDAVKHSYAAAKLLAQRAELMTFDLLLTAAPASKRARAVAASLATCLESFTGALLQHWTPVDPAVDVNEAPTPELRRLLAQQLQMTHSLPAMPLAQPVPAPTSAWHTTP